MTPEEIIVYIWRGLITCGITGLVWLLVWQRRVEKHMTQTDAEIEKIEEIIASAHDNKSRISVLENQVSNLNVSTEIREMETQLTDIAKTTHQQSGELKQMNINLKMVLDHLIGKK